VGRSAPDALDAETKGLVLLCECDSADCRETVSLSQAALEAFRRTNRPVLAPGHSLGRVEEARRSAAASVEDAQALRAQATHQLQRARKVRAARVLAVDDSEIFLGVAASVVGATTELRLVGTASSGEEAVRIVSDLHPDLVLLDIHMPGMDGFETAVSIRGRSPQTVIVFVSAEPNGLEAAAFAAGAVAVLDKVDLDARVLDDLWLKHRPAN
jgi:CheY-like chemotaxis protein